MRAAAAGSCRPGRTATRKRRRFVQGASAEAIDPGVLAGASGGQEDAKVAEIVGGLGDLLQIRQIGLASALGRGEIASVAVGRDEPENIGLRRS